MRFRILHAARSALAGLAVAMLAGCASVAIAPVAEDKAAKQFETPADQSSIYVVRGSDSGYQRAFVAELDGSDWAQLNYKHYVLYKRTPGVHTLKVTGHENAKQIRLATQAGESYFVYVRAAFGVEAARVVLDPVDGLVGRDLVKKARLVQVLSYDPLIDLRAKASAN